MLLAWETSVSLPREFLPPAPQPQHFVISGQLYWMNLKPLKLEHMFPTT
jgi:hypothetical protein